VGGKLVICNITGCAAVLTATGFDNGKWQFSTPYRIDTPQPITTNLSQVIKSATPTAMPNLVHIRPRGLLGE